MSLGYRLILSFGSEDDLKKFKDRFPSVKVFRGPTLYDNGLIDISQTAFYDMYIDSYEDFMFSESFEIIFNHKVTYEDLLFFFKIKGIKKIDSIHNKTINVSSTLYAEAILKRLADDWIRYDYTYSDFIGHNQQKNKSTSGNFISSILRRNKSVSDEILKFLSQKYKDIDVDIASVVKNNDVVNVNTSKKYAIFASIYL